MAKLLKLRGGTTSQHSSFTGAEREVTVDTDKETLVVHDGSTAGGFPLTRITWETKTSAFNVGINRGYFVNTSGGAVTATLPASPATGDMVRFIDLNATFDTNNLTVARNGKKIQGDTSDMTVATERAGFALVFSGDTQGWLLMEK